MSADFVSLMLFKNTPEENRLRVARKKNYKLNLSNLHAICEANYVRILRLFPDYENSNSREFIVGLAKVRIEVVERCRYTTFFRIHQHQSESALLGDLRIDVRAYHDARMLEVGVFQSREHIAPRYVYPNEDMYQQDEKSQQNRFLADWLEHCHRNGHVSTPVACDQPRL